MKPVNMLVRHDPATDSVGDCFRCCIASILELPGEDVPHFMALDWDSERHVWVEGNYRWYAALQAWLAPRGLAYFEVKVTPDLHGTWFKNLEPDFSVYHVLGGRSPRDAHAVVARNGVIVHDPSPQKDCTERMEPADDGNYAYGFLLAGGAR